MIHLTQSRMKEEEEEEEEESVNAMGNNTSGTMADDKVGVLSFEHKLYIKEYWHY